MNKKLNVIYYGGDYNPDQWDEDVWEEDIKLMKVFRVNVVTLPVFSWAKLQPSEDIFDFSWLDRVVDLLRKNNIFIIMATPTAAQPAWMSKKYPEMLITDVEGRKRRHGGRANFCPNSLDYRRLSRLIAEKMAMRYKDLPNLLMWHVNNEYGTYCYCNTCADAFRVWLKKRYGSLEELNKCWYTNFWGHIYYNWEEIEIPSHLTELLPGRLGDRDGTNFQSISIDYNRFMSDSIMDCYRNEADVIKKHTPNIPITTNFMGTFKQLDYFEWAEYIDIISWDNYPSNKDSVSNIAMRHDLMRGLKDGQPFLLMEQTPNQQNWQPYNALKRPGIMRLLSYQTIAHGGDSILFFQWRQSRAACEKFHAALVPHVGHENTRVGRELIQLGEELEKLGNKIVGSRITSRMAVIFDWPNWWAVEYSSGPSVDLKYINQVEKYYKAFYDLNIPVDMINPSDDLSKYDVVVAPVLYMIKENVAKKIEKFVSDGGTFITTFFSGIVDKNDLVILGGYPGAFRKVLGLWIEETDALYPDVKNKIVMKEKFSELKREYDCKLICDVIHTEGAKTLAIFGKDYYKGYPSLTENSYGKGKTIYVATDPEDNFIRDLIKHYCNEKAFHSFLEPQKGVEITQRVKGDKTFTFILNHNSEKVTLTLPEGKYNSLLNGEVLSGEVTILPKEVCILENW
jgi:beta-galactosidase